MAEKTIRRFDVFSVAKIYGFLTFVLGLIIGVIYGFFFMIFGAAMSSLARQAEGAAVSGISSIVIGLLIMIGMPIFYGILGFISGAIAALIYNGASGIIGGIKLELEDSTPPQYAGPATPPYQQWAPNQYPAQ